MLKDDIDGENVGTPPMNTHANVGTTVKSGKTFTMTVPANVNSYGLDVFGFKIDNLSGFTSAIFMAEPFVIDDAKEYVTKLVYDFDI